MNSPRVPLTRRARPALFPLEARLMFDAAAASDAVAHLPADAPDPATAPEPVPAPLVRPLADAPAAAASPVRELVFLDSSLPEAGRLVSLLRPGVEAVVLRPGEDPWAQMTDAVAGYSDLLAVHVVSHGSQGQLLLGGQTFSAGAGAGPAATAALAGWATHLAPEADILLYGCDIGAGAEGQALIEQVARLTQADVAASTDDTGATALGGDWVLEAQTGGIEATLFAAGGDLQAYPGLLAGTTVSSVALSSNAGTDATYKAGDLVSATVTFSGNETVTGTPTDFELNVPLANCPQNPDGAKVDIDLRRSSNLVHIAIDVR